MAFEDPYTPKDGQAFMLDRAQEVVRQIHGDYPRGVLFDVDGYPYLECIDGHRTTGLVDALVATAEAQAQARDEDPSYTSLISGLAGFMIGQETSAQIVPRGLSNGEES